MAVEQVLVAVGQRFRHTRPILNPHSRLEVRDLTVVWVCKQGGGGGGGLTRNPQGWRCREVASPLPAGHLVGATMWQVRCRGMAFCKWVLGFLRPCAF